MMKTNVRNYTIDLLTLSYIRKAPENSADDEVEAVEGYEPVPVTTELTTELTKTTDFNPMVADKVVAAKGKTIESAPPTDVDDKRE